MQRLGTLTDDLRTVIPRGARVGYIDYPMHINVGDLLIYLGAMHFFKSNGNTIASSFCVFDASARALDSLQACDVIVCHGGGNFGDIYPLHQKLRELTVSRFPHKPIVVMPQSFHFGSAAALRQSAAVFRRHGNITLCVRDRASETIALQHFSDQVMLLPDMAHRLYDGFAPIRSRPATSPDPLFLMRRDVEARGGATLPAGAKAQDWSDLLAFPEKLSIARYRVAAQLAGRTGIPLDILPHHHRAVDRVIAALAGRVARHQSWRTSRLHGAIFGLLLGKEVTLLDNSYGKNSRYFAQWGAGLANLAVADA